MRHQLRQDQLFFWLAPDSQLVLAFLHALDIAMLHKSIYILVFESGGNKIRFFCDFSNGSKDFIDGIIFAQAATNLLHAIFLLCVFIS